MKQLDIFDTDYKSHNYTDTSKSAYNKQKPKLKTKREQVYNLIKLNALTNYEISDELDKINKMILRVKETLGTSRNLVMTKKEKLKEMNKVLKPLEDILNQHYDKYIKEKKVETVIEDDSTLPAKDLKLK